METNIWSIVVYGILAVIYYYAGLRLWNENKKTVSLDDGKLHLKAVITMAIGVYLTYHFFDATISNFVGSLGVIPAFLPLVGMSKTKGIVGILDGRGDAGKKFRKILIVCVGVVIAFLALTYLPGIPYYSTLYSFSRYIGEAIIFIVGFWLIGNKDDELTKFGFGVLAVGVLVFLMHSGLFG